MVNSSLIMGQVFYGTDPWLTWPIHICWPIWPSVTHWPIFCSVRHYLEKVEIRPRLLLMTKGAFHQRRSDQISVQLNQVQRWS